MKTSTQYLSEAIWALAKLNLDLEKINIQEVQISAKTLIEKLYFAPEDNFLWNKLDETCENLDNKIIKTGCLANDHGLQLFTDILYIFNSSLRHLRSEELFSLRGWSDPNNHSYYRRTFAESRLGIGSSMISVDCGIRFYVKRDLFENLDCINAHNNIVVPLEEQMTDSSIGFAEHLNKVYLLSMNGDYLEKFGIAQACSILNHTKNLKSGLLFIIFDPTPESVQLLKKFIEISNSSDFEVRVLYFDLPSFENLLDRNTYLASIRFALVHKALKILKCTIVVTDADQLFKDGIEKITENSIANNYDISLFDYSLEYPFISLYAKYGASYVEFNNTPKTNNYVETLSRFISINLQYRSCWTLDQFALLYCRNLNTDIRINNLPMNLIGSDDKSIIWNMAGPSKFTSRKYSSAIRKELQIFLGENEN